jgi:hypothetical protein
VLHHIWPSCLNNFWGWFFLMVQAFEFRASHLWGSCTAAWILPPVHFALVILE